jgi:hypothetical protein
MMIDRGTALLLPRSWVSSDGLYHVQRFGCFQNEDEKPNRWPKDMPTVEQAMTRLT